MSKCFIKIIETNSIPGKIYGNFGMVQFAERNQVPPPLSMLEHIGRVVSDTCNNIDNGVRGVSLTIYVRSCR